MTALSLSVSLCLSPGMPSLDIIFAWVAKFSKALTTTSTKNYGKVANFNNNVKTITVLGHLLELSSCLSVMQVADRYIRTQHIPIPFSVISFVCLCCAMHTNNTAVTWYVNKIWDAVSTASVSNTKEISH